LEKRLLFRFGKDWTGQKIWIRQLPAAVEWREQGAFGQAFRAKALAGLEARALQHSLAMSRGFIPLRPQLKLSRRQFSGDNFLMKWNLSSV